MPQDHYEDDITIQVPVLKAQFDLLKEHFDARFDALCEQQKGFRLWIGANSFGIIMALIGVVALLLTRFL